MRKPHYLAKNHAGQMPVRCVFFDCETKPRPHGSDPLATDQELWFGYAAYVRRTDYNHWAEPTWFRFTDPHELWDWIEEHSRNRTALHVFAHNIGFDASVSKAFGILSDRGWSVKNPIMDDPPTWIKYRKENRSIILIDTLNYYRVPLRVLGESVGIAKLEMPAYAEGQELWDIYCKRDVEVIMYAMIAFMRFVEQEDLGNFAKTTPGQSFTAFRHRFMKHDIFIDDNEDALNLARTAYFGGRTECFRIGKIPHEVYCLDINSMYPYVMWENHFPTKLITHLTRVNISDLKEIMQKAQVVARVMLNTDEAAYPVRYESRLVFPIGHFEGWLVTPEIEYALEHDHIEEVYEICAYHHAPLFVDHINYFWNKRLEAKKAGDETNTYLHKIMMNGFYGKWGQNGRKFSDIGEAPVSEVSSWSEWDVDTQTLRKFRKFGGVIQEESMDAEGHDSHPAIASHITAYSRMYLWKLIQTAGRENVVYCDTDSLFVNEIGRMRLEPYFGDELGQLKLEWTSQMVEIRDNKDYSILIEDEKSGKLKWTAKIKGVRKWGEVTVDEHGIPRASQKGAAKIIWRGTADTITFISLDSLTFNVFKQDRFQSIKGKLREGNLNQQKITPIIKRYKREYRKGDVGDQGFVHPYHFPLPVTV